MKSIVRFITVSVLMLLSCSRKIPGTYNWSGNKIGPDIFRIELKSDNTFDYYGWSDVLGEDTINGTWYLNSDTLYLAMNKDYDKKFIRLQEGKIPIEEKQVLVLDEIDSSFLIGANVYINDVSDPLVVGPNGVLSMESSLIIKKISVNYLSHTDSVFVQNPDANKLEIYIDLMNRRQDKFFVNEKWLVQGRRLVPIIDGNELGKGIYKKE